MNDDEIKYYINRFDQIKNSPRAIEMARQFGINAAQDIFLYSWQQLEQIVDAFPSKDKKPAAQEDSNAAKLIYNQNNLQIYLAPSAQACIELTHDKFGQSYTFCVGRRQGNLYDTYRLRSRTFYFVYDASMTAKSTNHLIVIQAAANGTYFLTDAKNTGDTLKTWDRIVEIQPKLRGLEDLFKFIPFSDEEQVKVSMRQGPDAFDAMTYAQKYSYISTPINGNYHRLIFATSFTQLPSELKDLYITVHLNDCILGAYEFIFAPTAFNQNRLELVSESINALKSSPNNFKRYCERLKTNVEHHIFGSIRILPDLPNYYTVCFGNFINCYTADLERVNMVSGKIGGEYTLGTLTAVCVGSRIGFVGRQALCEIRFFDCGSDEAAVNIFNTLKALKLPNSIPEQIMQYVIKKTIDERTLLVPETCEKNFGTNALESIISLSVGRTIIDTMHGMCIPKAWKNLKMTPFVHALLNATRNTVSTPEGRGYGWLQVAGSNNLYLYTGTSNKQLLIDVNSGKLIDIFAPARDSTYDLYSKTTGTMLKRGPWADKTVSILTNKKEESVKVDKTKAGKGVEIFKAVKAAGRTQAGLELIAKLPSKTIKWGRVSIIEDKHTIAMPFDEGLNIISSATRENLSIIGKKRGIEWLELFVVPVDERNANSFVIRGKSKDGDAYYNRKESNVAGAGQSLVYLPGVDKPLQATYLL